MSEPKIIELSNMQLHAGFNLNKIQEIWQALDRGQSVTLVPPQPKLVHLSDLPEGARVRTGNESWYMFDGQLYGGLDADQCPSFRRGDHHPIGVLELLPGEFQFWQGATCPWPEGVEVEMEYVTRAASGKLQKHTTIGAAEHLVWADDDDDSLIIAHRCTGRLLDGAKLVP